MHARNDRHGQFMDRQHHARTLGEQLLVIRQLRVLRHFLEVVARAERAAMGGQHHHARTLVARHVVQLLLQCGEHVCAQRVEARWIVQRQGNHAARIARGLEKLGSGVHDGGSCVHRRRCGALDMAPPCKEWDAGTGSGDY